MVWVLRDGFGMVGSLIFSYVAGSHMDSNIKEWRLFADIANDVGLALDMVAPMFRGNFALVSSLATMCKVGRFFLRRAVIPVCVGGIVWVLCREDCSFVMTPKHGGFFDTIGHLAYTVGNL